MFQVQPLVRKRQSLSTMSAAAWFSLGVTALPGTGNINLETRGNGTEPTGDSSKKRAHHREMARPQLMTVLGEESFCSDARPPEQFPVRPGNGMDVSGQKIELR